MTAPQLTTSRKLRNRFSGKPTLKNRWNEAKIKLLISDGGLEIWYFLGSGLSSRPIRWSTHLCPWKSTNNTRKECVHVSEGCDTLSSVGLRLRVQRQPKRGDAVGLAATSCQKGLAPALRWRPRSRGTPVAAAAAACPLTAKRQNSLT